MKEDKKRELFARSVFGRRSQHVVRRIAQAVQEIESSFQDTIFTEEDYNAMLHNLLKRYNLPNHRINSTPISYRQAKIAYEMVFEGK